MNEKNPRFLKLEHFPILKVFKKSKDSLVRFECLEVDGHKIKVKITKKSERSFVPCPKCGRKNSKDALYCIYCDYVFEEYAKEIADTDLKPYEKKCFNCGRICHRNQKSCLYCGFGFASSKEERKITQEEYNGKNDKIIKLNIEGAEYNSTDKYLPADIKEFMNIIEKEGYSKEMVQEWIKKMNISESLRRRDDINRLNRRIINAWLRIGWSFLIVGIIIMIITLRSC